MQKTNCLLAGMLVLMSTLVVVGTSRAEGAAAQGARLYGQYCTPCHGKSGDGDGTRAFNEQLDPRPRVHANGTYMNHIPDMRLFRIIKFGGRSMGFSRIMPQWQHILTDGDIINLVAHIRSLADPPYQPEQVAGFSCALPRPENESGPAIRQQEQ